MTIQATRQVLFDGPRRAVMLFTGTCDGNGSDETNERKVIVSEMTPPCDRVTIEKVEYEVSGGIVRILWEDGDPKTILDLAARGILDFTSSGGIANPVVLYTPLNILFTTIGFDFGSSYSIKLTLRKKPFLQPSIAGNVPVGA